MHVCCADYSVVVELGGRIPALVIAYPTQKLLGVDAATVFICLCVMQRGILGRVCLLALDAKLAAARSSGMSFSAARLL